jgi:hypothetical protein
MSITPFLTAGVFDQGDIKAMSIALDDVCETLNILNGSPTQEVVAERIIALARNGERSPTRLRDRVLLETGVAIGAGKTDRNRKSDGNGAADGAR